MMRALVGCLIGLLALGAANVHGDTLQVCAGSSKANPMLVKPNSGLKVRTQCKVGKGGIPKEVSILSTDQVAAISDNTTAIAAIEAATTPTGAGTFQSVNSSGSFAIDNFGEGIPGTVLMGTMSANGDLGPQLRFARQPSGDFVDIGQQGDGTFTIERNDTAMLTVSPAVVGIGTDTGSVQLKLNGVGFNNLTAYIKARPADLLVLEADSDAGAVLLQLANDGNLFLNQGDALKQGGGPWGAISDARLKKNVQDLHGALDKFQALRGVTFEFIDPKAIGERPGTHIGFTAQQVEQVLPEWVGERADGVKYIAPKGFEALTVAAVNELRREKDDQVARLTAENRELRERLARLESAVERLGQHVSDRADAERPGAARSPL